MGSSEGTVSQKDKYMDECLNMSGLSVETLDSMFAQRDCDLMFERRAVLLSKPLMSRCLETRRRIGKGILAQRDGQLHARNSMTGKVIPRIRPPKRCRASHGGPRMMS